MCDGAGSCSDTQALLEALASPNRRRLSRPTESATCGYFGGSYLELHWEIFAGAAPQLLDRAQPVGRLACASRGFCDSLSAGRHHKLRVGSVQTSCIQSLIEGLSRISLEELEVLRFDPSSGPLERIWKQDIERALRLLSDCLGRASSLKTLSVRLPSFDAALERLRLSSAAWEALLRGLSALSTHQRLRSLELTSFVIKTQEGRQLRRASSEPAAGAGTASAAATATHSTTGGPPALTIMDVLKQMSTLEELYLTSDEIFVPTAQLFPQVFSELSQLKKVDLTRNHISKEVMQVVRDALPAKAELHGDDQQQCGCFEMRAASLPTSSGVLMPTMPKDESESNGSPT
eukprot:CAMPEP_0115073730 /NCGR_PEP_ID=MMETSP0227-20121206/14946_1 /TAXON_ID=89957 /ORGANISM="Polarella glacialis, Strain CCMP 1383" /LENGTH=346 /DNA_ID=CAMNT_0002460617 /DNA_START=69 /DNA_END=1106 /DNA_ORIENTATION=-